MKSQLQFYCAKSKELSNCGSVLDIEFSGRSAGWNGVVLEKGQSPHFYPENVYTPYFYFALALDAELNWNVEIDDRLRSIKTNPGNIWINPPKTAFTHHISEPCFFVILAIEEQQFLNHCPLNLNGKKLQFLNNYNVVDETIKGIMELFLLEARAKGRNGQTYVKHLISLLSAHYIQNYSNYHDLQHDQITASKFSDSDVTRVDKFIAQSIDQVITVEDLADLLRCSKFYFLREFKKLVGVTPYQYILNKRVEQAKELLSKQDANIAAIAQQLGFTDQSHFTRAFKAQVGVTPGKYVKTN